MTRANRPPGRPPAEAGPAVSRQDLLRIAARLIGERGFSATSIRSLAAEAGVTHGTVQHHFPNKDNLWKALVDEVLIPDFITARDQLSFGAEGSTFEAMLATRFEQAMTRPGLPGTVLMDHSDGASERLGYLADLTQAMRTEAISLVETLISADALRPVNPIALQVVNMALACVASMDTALRIFHDVDLSDDGQRSRLAADISDIILHGVMPRP